ncbi:putrescine ABC transporter permease PotI, partial [Klebsiella pneumoniae]
MVPQAPAKTDGRAGMNDLPVVRSPWSILILV